jgi:nucleoid DNA-binding protein
MASKKGLTRSELTSELAEKTGLKSKEIVSVFKELEDLLKKELKKGHQASIFGLFKIEVKDKAARPARTMKSPFTGEMIKVAAKPASKAVKIKPSAAIASVFTPTIILADTPSITAGLPALPIPTIYPFLRPISALKIS